MAPVPPHPGRHVLGIGVGEEAGVVIGGLGQLPHVVELVHHQQAQAVAQVQQLPGGRIVAGADGVHAHLLHQPQLPFRRLFVERRAQRAQIVVQAHAVQLDDLAVEEKALIRGEFRFPEAHGNRLGLLAQGQPQAVEHGHVRRPGKDIRQLDGQAVAPVMTPADQRFPARSSSR